MSEENPNFEVKFNPNEGLRPLPLKDRMTVVLRVYHEHQGTEPFSIDSSGWSFLGIEEQPYQRWCKAVGLPQKLDYGWLEDNVGTIILENTSKERTLFVRTHPRSKSIYHIVKPGHPERFTLNRFDGVEVWTDGEQCPFTLTALPK